MLGIPQEMRPAESKEHVTAGSLNEAADASVSKYKALTTGLDWWAYNLTVGWPASEIWPPAAGIENVRAWDATVVNWT